MPVTIFLLRAVNLGGASTIKMAALRALCPPLDHVAFGRFRPNAKNVIDSWSLEHCSCEKPVPTFSRNALGLRHAATLLQSGNLVASHDGEARDTIALKLEEAIAATHPMRPRVIARSQAELQDILAQSPLPAAERQPNWLLVMPLDAVPTDGAIDRLRAWHKGSEEIGLRGRDLYLHYSEGIGRSKLTNAVIERHLGVQGTARNWTTLTKLAALAQEVAGHG